MKKLDCSIIIPVYCRDEESASWLVECLQSACRQNCDVVVYNDGSPYPVYDIVKAFPVIYAEENGNNGVSYARNYAISIATTECVLPLDCDDRLSDGAVEKLYDLFHESGGIPVYPDVSKFGDEVDPHYELLDFSCDHIVRYVGFSSVNVIHAKGYWQALGGYDESLKFYEDGEYNARLFAKYCGVRLPIPLVQYRIHKSQRTKQYESESRKFALTILERIRRIDMACSGCGKRRTQGNLPSGVSQQKVQDMAQRMIPDTTVSQDTVKIAISGANTSLPLMFEGRYLAVYIGGEGRGKHYYNGIVSRNPYKVQFGDYVYVDIRDARRKDDQEKRTMFVLVEDTNAKPGSPLPVVEVVKKSEPAPVTNKPIEEPTKKVVIVEDTEVRAPRSAKIEKKPKK